MIADVVEDHTGRRPEYSTAGGTSDARFIKDVCPVAEFGLVGQTMHKVDERVDIADLDALAAIYASLLQRVLRRITRAQEIQAAGGGLGAADLAVFGLQHLFHPKTLVYALPRPRPACQPCCAPDCAGKTARRSR